MAAWRRNRIVGLILAAWAVVVWLAVVYLGEHYVTDVLGGIAYAIVAVLIVRTITARWPRHVTASSPAGPAG